MPRYNIAGISLKIVTEAFKLLNEFNPFISLNNEHTDMKIQLKGCDLVPKPEGKILTDEGFVWLRGSFGGEDTCVYMYGEEPEEILCMLNVNKVWNNARILYLKGKSTGELAISGGLGEILFRNRILFHQGIVIHASAIEWHGKGIMFSAASGTGKSTQANLWKKHMGAKILNGDRPAVRVVDYLPYVYGTPWSGSSCEFINSSAPLSAVVMLEQAQENTIRCLSNHEAVAKLMPRAFLPYYSPQLMNLAMNNLERIILSTPVYLLKCRPDIESVELLYQKLTQCKNLRRNLV